MSNTRRPLLAARTSSGEASGADAFAPGKPPAPARGKRTLVESACQACRRRKSKCDGQRPNCGRCGTLSTECIYDAEEGESRWGALRRRNYELEQEHTRYQDLFTLIRTSSEADAMVIFRSLRSGSAESLFSSLAPMPSDAAALANISAHLPPASSEQRLPPINSLLVTNAGMHGLPAPASTHRATMGAEDSLTPPPMADGVHAYPGRGQLTAIDPMLDVRPNVPSLPSLLGSESSGSSIGYNSPSGVNLSGQSPGHPPMTAAKRDGGPSGTAVMITPSTQPSGSVLDEPE